MKGGKIEINLSLVAFGLGEAITLLALFWDTQDFHLAATYTTASETRGNTGNLEFEFIA